MTMRKMLNCKGLTLVEMMVAMGIFMVILLVGTLAFERVLKSSSQQSKSAQSNFEGVVGLEMVRYDLEHAGYGVPWTFQNYTGEIQFKNLGGTANKELDVADNVPVSGVNAASLNATGAKQIWPISAGSSVKEVNGAAVTNASGGPDYLVVRSTVSALSDTARKWSYVNYTANATTNLSFLKSWGNGEDIASGDRFVTVRSTFTTDGKETKMLLMDNLNNFEVGLSGGAMPSGNYFKPTDSSDVVVAYGVRPAASSALRMPYNRTDYYVARPAAMPQHCNSGTGVLYKAMVDHGTGGFETPYPLLDCVGDMQLEFEYDANNDGNISYLTPQALAGLTAAEIRSGLKNVRAYVLTHEGGRDKSYSYPGNTVQVGDKARPASSGRTLSATEMGALFGTDWRTYRWKIYTIVTRPKNLAQ